LAFELYAVIGQKNGSGYPLAYLFLDNSKKGDGVRTLILAGFFNSLKHKELNPEFFLTDKDFAQINAALQVWPLIKIQLCFWHLKRAIKKKGLQMDRFRKQIATMQNLPTRRQIWLM